MALASYEDGAVDAQYVHDGDIVTGGTVGWFVLGWRFWSADGWLNNQSSGVTSAFGLTATYSFKRKGFENPIARKDTATGLKSRNAFVNEPRPLPFGDTPVNKLQMRGALTEVAPRPLATTASATKSAFVRISDVNPRGTDIASARSGTYVLRANDTNRVTTDTATAVSSLHSSTPVERVTRFTDVPSAQYIPAEPVIPTIPGAPNAIPDVLVTVYNPNMTTIYSMDVSRTDMVGTQVMYEDTPGGCGSATIVLGLYNEEVINRGYWTGENIVEISAADSLLVADTLAGQTKLYVDSNAPFDTNLGEDRQQAYVRSPAGVAARIPVVGVGSDAGGQYIVVGNPSDVNGNSYQIPALSAGSLVGRRRFVGRIKGRSRANDRARRSSVSLIGLSSTLSEANGTFTINSLDVGPALYACLSQFASRWPFLTIARANFPMVGANYSGTRSQSSVLSMCSDILSAITNGDVWVLRVGHDRVVRLVQTYSGTAHLGTKILTMPQGVYEFEPLNVTINDEDTSGLYNAILVTGDTDPQTKQPCSAIVVDSSSVALYGRQIDGAPVSNQACKTDADCVRYAQTLLNHSSLALANNSFRVYTRNDRQLIGNTPGGIRQGDVIRAVNSVIITRFDGTGTVRNAVPDSNFAYLDKIWVRSNMVAVIGDGFANSTAIECDANGGGQNIQLASWIDVAPGQWRTVQVYVDASNVQSNRPGIFVYDYDTGALLQSATQAPGAIGIVYASFQVPVGTYKLTVKLTANGANSALTPRTIRMSRPMLSLGNQLLPYQKNEAAPPISGLVASVTSTIILGNGSGASLDRYQEVQFAAVEPDWSASLSERTNAIATALTNNRRVGSSIDSYCVSAEAFPPSGIPFSGLVIHPPSFAALFAQGSPIQIVGNNYFTVSPNATNWAWLSPDGSWSIQTDITKVPGAILYALFQTNGTTVIGTRNLASVGISSVGAAAVASGDYPAPTFAQDPNIVSVPSPAPTESNIEISGTLNNVPTGAVALVVLYREHVDVGSGQTPGPWIPELEFPLVGGMSQPVNQSISPTLGQMANGHLYDFAVQYRGSSSYGLIAGPVGTPDVRQNGYRAQNIFITAPYLAGGEGYLPQITVDTDPFSLQSPDNINAAVQVNFTLINQPQNGSLRKVRLWYRNPSPSDIWADGGALPAVGLGSENPPTFGEYTFVLILPLGAAYEFAMSTESVQGGQSEKVPVGNIDASEVVIDPSQLSRAFQNILNSAFYGLQYSDAGELVIPPHVEICPSQQTFSLNLGASARPDITAYQTQQSLIVKMRCRSDHTDTTAVSDFGFSFFADGNPESTEYRNGYMVQLEPSSISIYRKQDGTYYYIQGFGQPPNYRSDDLSGFNPLDGRFHTLQITLAPHIVFEENASAQATQGNQIIPGSMKVSIYYDNIFIGVSYIQTGHDTLAGYFGPRNQAPFPAFIDRQNFSIKNGAGTVNYDELDPTARGVLTSPSDASTNGSASALAPNTVGSSQMATPDGQNLVYNPSGTKNLSGWSASGNVVQWTSSTNLGGSIRGFVNVGSNVDEVLQQQLNNLQTGTNYVASAIIQVNAMTNGAIIGLDVVDSDGNYLGGFPIYQPGKYEAVISLQTRTSSVAYIRLHITGTPGGTAADAYWQRIQFERGTIATVFGDDTTTGISTITQLPTGGIDLANPLNLNWNYDALPTGPNYGKIAAGAIQDGRALIDFEKAHLNKFFSNIGGYAGYSQLDQNSVGVALSSVGNVTGPGASVTSTGSTQGFTFTVKDVEQAQTNGQPISPPGTFQRGQSGLGGYPGLGYFVGQYTLAVPASSNAARWYVTFDHSVYGVNTLMTIVIFGSLSNAILNIGHANAFYNVYQGYVPTDGNVPCYLMNCSSSFSGSLALAAGQATTIQCAMYVTCSNAVIQFQNGPSLTRATQTQSRLEVGKYAFQATRYA